MATCTSQAVKSMLSYNAEKLAEFLKDNKFSAAVCKEFQGKELLASYWYNYF